MCGILALFNNRSSYSASYVANNCFKQIVGRGPEQSSTLSLPLNCYLGFHRLAINGLDSISGQPMTIDNITLICNGEIYNHTELFKLLNIVPQTNSDCEIIIHLYKLYGIEYTLSCLDGVFAFVLVDFNNSIYNGGDPSIIIARDPYGVRPLYMLTSDPIKHTDNIYTNGVTPRIIHENIIGFSSEMKGLNKLLDNGQLIYKPKQMHTLIQTKNSNIEENDKLIKIKQFEPGTYSVLTHTHKAHANWEYYIQNRRYTSFGYGSIQTNVSLVDSSQAIDMQELYSKIRFYIEKAVEKRVKNTDRPIACLLSGGLDSSLITALSVKYSSSQLSTYSIGLANSEDISNARVVAKFLNTKHTEIIVSEEDFFAAIEHVIRDIESYDTTTVRASVGNYLIGKHIANHGGEKVIMNGDGSDELMGGYLYFHKAPSSIDFDHECKRLLNDIYMYDVLRSDKCISTHGLEPRTPFLDREWIQFYLSIPASIRNHTIEKTIEKYLIRSAFAKENILPDDILWRRKEAFSDGVSAQTRSWFEIIKEKIDILKKQNHPFMEPIKYTYLPPKTDEELYYRNIFEHYYPKQGKILPYFWMPKFVNAKDASARTLDIY